VKLVRGRRDSECHLGMGQRPVTPPGVRLPPTQEIDQCLEDSPTVSFLVVPRRYEVQHGENDRHQERDEQYGSHRLLPPRLRRRVTSSLLSLLAWFIGEWLAAVDSSTPLAPSA
jgi:hypothetical protein